MNRLELERKIIKEGKKRGITVTEVGIYDRGDDGLEFCPRIRNDYNDTWVYDFNVKELISDLAPVERKHTVEKVELERHNFRKGDIVQVDDIWIRLDGNENEDKIKNILDYGSCCGSWRQGWMKGKVVSETDYGPNIMFERDIWVVPNPVSVFHIRDIDKAVKNGSMEKVEKGQTIWCGYSSWAIRKYRSKNKRK